MLTTQRPRIEMLSREFAEKIIDEGLTVLDRQGILVENREAQALLLDAGAVRDRTTQRLKIGRGLVEACLASTPSEIMMYDRSGAKAYRVGGDDVHFDPGSAAVVMLDHETQQERKAETRDLIDLYRLVETLENIHFQSTGLISADVPAGISDGYRLYLGLLCSAKPFVTGTFRVEGFAPMRDFLVSVRGGATELAAKPLAIFDACPSPPLKWSNLTAQSLIDAARSGIPSELIAMGMTGATSPATIAGTLVQIVAENVCGLVICQLAKKGAPVIFGGSPSSFDMRKGTTPMGAIETMMIDAAYAQVGKCLRLPTHAYMALSDAKVNDPQAGIETALGAALAALAGINVISGPGMLDFESCQSLEKLVIDNEICGMTYRLIAGIAQRDEPLALDLLEGLGPDSQFLSLAHTRKWYRQEHTLPRLADRDPYEAWVTAGRTTMTDKAHKDVADRLAKFAPAPLPDDVRRELEKTMTAYARSQGMDALPEAALLAMK